MILSKHQVEQLEKSVTEPINVLRIAQSGGMTIEEMDDRLAALQAEILNNIVKNLNLLMGIS